MLSGLLEKAVRESWRVVAVTCVAIAAVMAAFVQILPQFEEGLNEIVLQVPFLQTILSGLMGVDVSAGLAPQMLLVVVWSHPVVLSIIWGFAVVLGTRLPAEIEHGTADVLLGWPVSRRAVFGAEGILCLAAGLLVLAAGFLGFQLSAATLPAELHPEAGNTLLTLANLLAVHVAVTGTVQCIAAACDRRGKAMGFAVGFLLASYLVAFLSRLWEPAERIAFVSFVTYYEPARVMLDGTPPVQDLIVLALWGTLLWLLGCLVWTRRSVLTV